MDSYFERKLKGPPFSDNEDKKYEFCRLGSFKQWPKENPVFPLKLSQAGFYHTGAGDEVVCYKCGASKNNWQEGDDPLEIHRALNPDCPFLNENSHGNIPFAFEAVQTPNIQRLDSLLEDRAAIGENALSEASDSNSDVYTSLSSPTNAEDSPSSNPSSSGNSVPPVPQRLQLSINDSDNRQSIGTEPGTSSRSGDISLPTSNSAGSLSDAGNVPDSARVETTRREAYAAGDKKSSKKEKVNKKNKKEKMDSTRQPAGPGEAARGYDIPPPTGASIGPLRFERNRLETFKNWPSNACVSAAELAKQGFHYPGTGDRVQCIFCKGTLRNWEQGDRPHIEHRKHFPRCPLVLGMSIGNVPLPPSSASTSPTSPLGIANRTSLTDALGAGHGAILGLITDRPKHPQYAIESQRLSSFHGWRPYKHQTPQQLASAGFFYAGFNDNVKCFYCDGGLRNWEPGDDPWKEHARWFPRCPYVLQVKGQEFINAIVQDRGVLVPPSAATRNPSQGSRGQSAEGGGFQIEEREVRARMDSPHVRKLLDNGVDSDLIMRTVRKRLRETGDDFPSCTALFEAVHALETEEAARSPQNSMQSQNPSAAQSHDATVGQSQNPPISQNSLPSQNAVENEAKPEAPGSEMKEQSSELPGNSSRADDLEKENMELKEQRMCKICMSEESNVVFFPCGHLVACASCAPALTLCPICRAQIKGTIRTYIA